MLEPESPTVLLAPAASSLVPNGRNRRTPDVSSPRVRVWIALLLAVAAATTVDAVPTRLTLSPGQDINPAWDPRGNTIAYMRSGAASGAGVPYNLYQVQAGIPGESVMATGPTDGFGLANSPAWIGATGFLGLEERAVFHEYLKFDASKAPFTRVVGDGNDAAFTRLLQITGGTGGGRIAFSRDGLTALWRWSSQGGSGTQQIRFGPTSALTGQSTSTPGTALVQTSHATEQRMLGMAAVAPNGSFAILTLPWDGPNGSTSHPTDLWLYRLDGSTAPVNLTNEGQGGAYSNFPEVLPGGDRILYARFSGLQGETWDLYEMKLDGTGRRQVTSTPQFAEYYPSVSNDGTRVAFVGLHLAGFENSEPALPAGETANANIYVMPLESGPPVQVTMEIFPAVELEWPSEGGVTYQLQYSDDAVTWQNLGEPMPGTGSLMKVFQPARSPATRLYRMQARR